MQKLDLYDATATFVATVQTRDVDLDGNGTINPEAERGLYDFIGLDAGTYSVIAGMNLGWVQTSNDPTAITIVGSTSGEVGTSLPVGALSRPEITGRLYEDMDGDGVESAATDPGLAGWTVFLDANFDDRIEKAVVRASLHDDFPLRVRVRRHVRHSPHPGLSTTSRLGRCRRSRS